MRCKEYILVQRDRKGCHSIWKNEKTQSKRTHCDTKTAKTDPPSKRPTCTASRTTNGSPTVSSTPTTETTSSLPTKTQSTASFQIHKSFSSRKTRCDSTCNSTNLFKLSISISFIILFLRIWSNGSQRWVGSRELFLCLRNLILKVQSGSQSHTSLTSELNTNPTTNSKTITTSKIIIEDELTYNQITRSIAQSWEAIR